MDFLGYFIKGINFCRVCFFYDLKGIYGRFFFNKYLGFGLEVCIY